jgi:hypothetical protein
MKLAVIVDPFSTGQEYPGAFRDAGWSPVAVLTSATVPAALLPSWHPENFDQVHVFGGDVAALAAELRAWAPGCLIPGGESGVLLADALVELVLPGRGNVAGLATSRRDKWEMVQALARSGVPHLRQVCTDDPDVVSRWLGETGVGSRRLVLKPPKSGGTDNVHFVSAGDDWRPAFDSILGHVNRLDLVNDAVLVSEFAEGTEFLVDSYSVDGRHGLVDVCRYTKGTRGDRIGIYDCVEFLSPDDPGVLAVWPYTQRVLDAVGIRNGCGHAEVMLTPDGPRLIEVGARPAGGGHQLISDLATGDNHIKRTVAHWVSGAFKPSYRLIQYLRGVFISSPRAGIWRNAEIFDQVESLPTFYAKNFPYGTGDIVPATEDLFTFLAWVIVTSPHRRAVDADYRRIKEWESLIQVDPVDRVSVGNV